MVTAVKKRPLAGSATGKIWAAADRLVEQLGRMPTGREVVDEVAKSDPSANQGTGFTQYSHWKKAYLAHFERGPRPKTLADGAVAVTVGVDGRLVIPASFREALGWKAGDLLDLRQSDGRLVVEAAKSRLRRAQEIVARFDRGAGSVVDELIAERRRAAEAGE